MSLSLEILSKYPKFKNFQEESEYVLSFIEGYVCMNTKEVESIVMENMNIHPAYRNVKTTYTDGTTLNCDLADLRNLAYTEYKK